MASYTEYRIKEWLDRLIYTEESFAQSKRNVTIFDFYSYLKTMNKAGVLGSWLHNLPGFHLEATPRQKREGPSYIKKLRRILRKMDDKDVKRPDLISAEKRSWIARKARVSIEDIHFLIDRFEDMRFYAKMHINRIVKYDIG